MTDRTLKVLLSEQVVGDVQQNSRGKLTFTYTKAWRSRNDAYPISLSMPLAAAEHKHAAVDAYLWGLLPDNEQTLAKWARRFQVSARNPFALMAHVGEDCAGAIQFVRPERLDALLSMQPPEPDWLDEAEVAARLRALREDPAASRMPGDTGQFSLAGAQPKTALLDFRGRWGVPSGRIPTTHILKPPTAEFDGHAENEHYCLRLANALDLPTAYSEVRFFGDEVAIVVERYDRILPPQPTNDLAIVRVHQEDMCQASGLLPIFKYQNEGGPSPSDILGLLALHSSRPEEDCATFIEALALNWLVAGTDAHAKNYSILYGSGGALRLAPLYDIASALPYDRLDLQQIKLAMKIGGEYRLRDIGLRQWRKFADAIAAQGLTHPIIPRLADAVAARAMQCARALRP